MSINSSPRTRAWIRIAVVVVFAIVAGILAVALYGSPFDDNSQNEINNSDPTTSDASSDAPSAIVTDPITDPEQFPEPDVETFAANLNVSDDRNDLLPENLQGGMFSIYDQVEDPAGRPDTRSYDCKVIAGIEVSDTCIVRFYFDGYVWILFQSAIDGEPRWYPDLYIGG